MFPILQNRKTMGVRRDLAGRSEPIPLSAIAGLRFHFDFNCVHRSSQNQGGAAVAGRGGTVRRQPTIRRLLPG
jgi:hypothetical protein